MTFQPKVRFDIDWCSHCVNIRTNARFFKIGKGDCLRLFSVIECDDHFVIIEEDCIDKAVNESSSVFDFVGV